MAKEQDRSTQLTRTGSLLLAAGLLVAGFAAAFGPWVWRPAVALQLTAPGLAEFVKFLPSVRTTQLQLQRLYFLLPLFVTMLALPLLACNRQLAIPGWLRWLMRLAVVPLALGALSPVWTPTILLAPEFRLQTLLAGLAVGLAVIAPLFRRLPLWSLVGLLLIGGVAALGLPWWQFTLARPDIQEAYHEAVNLGWGWWLTVAGLLTAMAGGGLALQMTNNVQGS
jgi:hypothetical protein